MHPHDSNTYAGVSDLVAPILTLLAAADAPLPCNQILSALPNAAGIKLDQLTLLLDRLVAQGRLTAYAPYRTQHPRYWDRPEEEYVRSVVRSRLADRSLVRAELLRGISAQLKGIPAARQVTILRRMLAEGTLHEFPPFLGARAKRIALQPLDPGEYVEDALRKLTDRLTPLGIPPTALRTALVTPQSRFSQPTIQPLPAAAPPTAAQPVATVAETILQCATDAFPQAGQGALISFSQFRGLPPIAHLQREQVDQALIELAKTRRIALHAHDFPLGLASEAREMLLRDERGNHYMGFTLRTRS